VPCAAWRKKKPEELTVQDYISFGQERCNEAQRAAKRLSLNPQDEIFLSFPDKGLLPLWEEKYDVFYLSETTQISSSPYKSTFNLAKKGYSRQNLLIDISDILVKYKPRYIYMPHPLDTNADHQATAYFVNCALGALKGKENTWLDDLKVSYYLIHGFLNNVKLKNLAVFSQTANSRRDLAGFQRQKDQALNEYNTQLNTEKEKSFLKNFVKEEETFWDLPADKETYLKQLEEEWLGIAKIMRQSGFNVNFGPVVDVAEEIEDRDIYLVKRQRLYSQSPNNVVELAGRVIEGLNKGGVIPVLKHFPGLGAARLDTHIQLPILEKTKERLYNEDLAPFKSLINKYPNVWVMIDHAVYPSLSDKPASLSYEIQANILRKELGFKGIIIADELLNMQSVLEYVYREKIAQPFIGDIVVRAFQAGTDIALIYLPPEKAEGIISHIMQSVTNAVREGRIKEDDIDISVRRILVEKERVFGRPLARLLQDMSLEEKIYQKIAVDIYSETKLLNKYNFCGFRPRAQLGITVLQNQVKIPMFIFAQHEGGMVNDRLLKLSTRSAYMVGREFERLADKNVEKNSSGAFGGDLSLQNSRAGRKAERKNIPKIALKGADYDKAISSLLDSIDKLIELFSELRQKGTIPPPHPNYLTPLTVNSDNSFELKPFNRLPVLWLRSFPDENSALSEYEIFKNIYQEWIKKQTVRARGAAEIVASLVSLRKSIEKSSGKKEDDKSNIRVLCLAAHPDDEDGEALAYFGKKFHCQTYVLLATRGEAGENAVSSSFYEELGALRMEEMEKSAAILGVKKVYYLGKKDFGYSVTAEEAFKNWDKRETLEKLVYFIRLIRPHIIITRHNTTNSHEHGQHQALSILAEEAFDLAGNPQSYPWMLNAGLSAWQPAKFYQRSIGRQDASFNSKPVILDILEPIDSKNKNCREIASEAFNQHKSQAYLPRVQGNKSGKILYQLVKPKSFFPEGDSFFDFIKADGTLTEPAKEVSPSGLPGVLIVNKLRIALLEGNTNIMFVALKTLGYDFKCLDEEYILKGDLSQFDTIILGQGVYTFYKVFEEANIRLLEFVKNGGNLIVFQQYSIGQDLFNYAPYPFKISFEPVTNKDTPVNILAPGQQLFNLPNQISTQDFTGWVQDRGFFFCTEYSNKYAELTECFSSRGNRVRGGYLIADYGKGSYIYTGYSWYRQLREFHVGTYKNLSNMLAYLFVKNNSTFNKE